jgi:hypothetical protein|tara:strand:+ start:6838 stop:7200 length:363 start_codon:yes stop_codon:yes gene_type:complete
LERNFVFISAAFILFLILILLIISVTVIIAIKGHIKVTKKFRNNLKIKLEKLPFYAMLQKRNIDINKYLEKFKVDEIEEHLVNCKECESKEKCLEMLEDDDSFEEDYSFCPNDEHFRENE